MRSLIVLLVVLNLGVALWQLLAAPPVAAPAPVTLPAGTPPLVLADAPAQPNATPAAGGTAAPAAVPPAAPSAAGSGQCHAFGPVATMPASQDLLGLAVGAVQRTEHPETPAPSAWRVVAPPQATLDDARALQQRLIAAGFTDQILVAQGEEAHTIALGRFGQRANAERHRQALAEQGFTAQVQPADTVIEPSVAFELAQGVSTDAVRHRLQLLRSQPVDCAQVRASVPSTP